MAIDEPSSWACDPTWRRSAVSAVITLTLTVTALAIFKRAERTFADVI